MIAARRACPVGVVVLLSIAYSRMITDDAAVSALGIRLRAGHRKRLLR